MRAKGHAMRSTIRRLLLSLSLAGLSLAGCGESSDTPAADAGTDASSADASSADASLPTTDAGRDAGADAGGCRQVRATTWTSLGATDVDIEFRSLLSPTIEGRSELSILFERYSADSPVGTFTLGPGGPDANFGDCSRCVFVGIDPSHAYFADRGTIVVRRDPYSGRLDASLSDVRLIEVDVDPFTRESTPVEDGACLELEDLTANEFFPPEGWTCDARHYDDGEACHCECGVFDPDCGFHQCFPDDPGCTPREALPRADCAASEQCAFSPVIGSTRCVASCDWSAREGCGAGVCVYSIGVEPFDTCVLEDDVLDTARLGEPCTPNGFQKFCEIVDRFALGYCDYEDLCRPVCASDAECTTHGESCQRFFGEDGLGYCGPPFSVE